MPQFTSSVISQTSDGVGERCLLVSFVAYTHVFVLIWHLNLSGAHIACIPVSLTVTSMCRTLENIVLAMSPRLVKVREIGLYRLVTFSICCLKASSVFVFVSIDTDRNGSGVIKGMNIFGMFALIL
jgi:hypothetical protein